MTPGNTNRPRDSALESVFHPVETVRFIHWRTFTTAKSAVYIVMTTAVVSFITGLSILSQPDVPLDGPIITLFPGWAAYVQVAGILFAFVLGALGIGLYWEKRLAWYTSILFIPLVALIPLATLRPADIPLLVLVLVTLPLLITNRNAFDQRFELTSLQIASLAAAIGVTLYGVIGSYVFRDQFRNIESVSDSFYYIVVTIATVGYGDITPTSVGARWFALSVIIFGTGAYTVAIGSLVVPAIERRMAAAFGNMTPARLHLLEDHILVLGYSDITESLLDELGDQREVVVITPQSEEATDLDNRGIDAITADPTDPEILLEAGIDVASGVVVATRDDAQDVLSVLAVRQTNPDVRIVAAANDAKHEDKLVEVGADDVVSPMAIGGRLLGRSVLEETSVDMLFETEQGDDTIDEE